LCCNGCAGGTSYVTGTNVPANFCATGGAGGLSDFNSVCYSNCGCNWSTQGLGYNGDVIAAGSTGVIGFTSGTSSPIGIYQLGGTGGGPGGGHGGIGSINNGNGEVNNAWCCVCSGDHYAHGRIPGGGGAGSGWYTLCQCTAYYSGRGAPGMVKITY
jgi:hypothetical protein